MTEPFRAATRSRARGWTCGWAVVVPAGIFLAGAACAVFAAPFLPARPAAEDLTKLSAVARIGADMFYDPALSGGGQMSCASCHDPANHYGPSQPGAVEMGGPKLDLPGYRAVPSLTYKEHTPAFSIGPVDEGNDANEATPQQVVQDTTGAAPAAVPVTTAAPAQMKSAATSAANMVPRGGMFWDGRADTLQDQTEGPLMAPFEMANADTSDLARRIRIRYGDRLAVLFGHGILDNPGLLVAEAGFALARYQIEAPQFHPYSSKYDAWLAGQAQLSPAEERGRLLFNDPKKGNCADCHVDTVSADGTPPAFTDYEYEALGLPRNPAIPANADPGWFDLGICGPMRDDDYARQAANCGMFKTPTLRNVASRHALFHNGVYTDLRDAIRFYVERSTAPEKIYHGSRRPDDLPPGYVGNLDTVDPPFDRPYGAEPALDEAEIGDIVAFLDTLTDGWSRGNP